MSRVQNRSIPSFILKIVQVGVDFGVELLVYDDPVTILEIGALTKISNNIFLGRLQI